MLLQANNIKQRLTLKSMHLSKLCEARECFLTEKNRNRPPSVVGWRFFECTVRESSIDRRKDEVGCFYF